MICFFFAKSTIIAHPFVFVIVFNGFTDNNVSAGIKYEMCRFVIVTFLYKRKGTSPFPV